MSQKNPAISLKVVLFLSLLVSFGPLAVGGTCSNASDGGPANQEGSIGTQRRGAPNTFRSGYRAEMKEKQDYILYRSDGLKEKRSDELEEREKQEHAWEMLRNMIIQERHSRRKGAQTSPDDRPSFRAPQ
jgi:hypothetical protein